MGSWHCLMGVLVEFALQSGSGCGPPPTHTFLGLRTCTTGLVCGAWGPMCVWSQSVTPEGVPGTPPCLYTCPTGLRNPELGSPRSRPRACWVWAPASLEIWFKMCVGVSPRRELGQLCWEPAGGPRTPRSHSALCACSQEACMQASPQQAGRGARLGCRAPGSWGTACGSLQAVERSWGVSARGAGRGIPARP